VKNIFNTLLFRITIFLFLMGTTSLILENNFYQYLDEDNVLHESLFMPLGVISIFASIICFILLLVKMYIHCYERNKSLKENIIGINLDYSDTILSVYFEVSDKKLTEDILSEIDFIEKIKDIKNGFILDISAQQIPEVISHLFAVNVAIYAVIPQKE
jgi:nitrate reductase gamma subunit